MADDAAENTDRQVLDALNQLRARQAAQAVAIALLFDETVRRDPEAAACAVEGLRRIGALQLAPHMGWALEEVAASWEKCLRKDH